MPEIDGFETCERLKANPATKGIAVIFVTARTEVEDVVRGFKAGSVDYIIKPFKRDLCITRDSSSRTLFRMTK